MANQLTSLPNLITLGRIAAIPVILLLAASGNGALRWLALVLFILAALSDWLDGYLARRSALTSPLGQMLDPIADKLLVAALIVVLAWDRSLSALDLVPAVVILLREVFVAGLREFVGARAGTIKVTALAKWKTTVQLVALAFVLAEPLIPGLSVPSDLLLWLAAVLTAITGAQYFAGAWPHLKGDAP